MVAPLGYTELVRILVVRLTALGDVVLSTALVSVLRRTLPEAHVELLTEARLVALFREASSFDRVIGYDRKGKHAGMAGVARVRSELDPRYDVVVDLQGKLRTRALVARLESPKKLTLTKRSPARALLALFGQNRPIVSAHTIDLYLKVLEPLGVPFDPDARTQLRRAPRTSGKKVGLSVGATHATKCWPGDHFLDLARAIRSRYSTLEIVPIGGPSDAETVERIAREVNGRNDVPSLDVLGLWRVISDLDVLVGVDSGPTHLAAAVGVPVVALFGPTSPKRWGPRGSEHRLIAPDLSCAPCSNTGGKVCPIGTHACLRDLSVDRVLEDTVSLLERPT
ncbi:MAG: glycosyltransferase family 9 protein [Deltaproteobacteria bacterium]|nr:glycosyltransferase family 9 protein [Deltaproteobacteria bacterium]